MSKPKDIYHVEMRKGPRAAELWVVVDRLNRVVATSAVSYLAAHKCEQLNEDEREYQRERRYEKRLAREAKARANTDTYLTSIGI